MEDIVQGSQQLVYLSFYESCLQGIVEGAQATAANTDELCIHMKL